MNDCRPARGGCGPSGNGALDSLDEIVRDYNDKKRRQSREELDVYRKQRTLGDCIEQLGKGKCHPHQYRVGKKAMAELSKALLVKESDLAKCKTFGMLLARVDSIGRPIYRIGDLAIYDAAQRIGAWLGLEPDVVYLHAGVTVGANALGLRRRNGVIVPADLPDELKKLRPYEVEDLLCIYKDVFKKLKRQKGAGLMGMDDRARRARVH